MYGLGGAVNHRQGNRGKLQSHNGQTIFFLQDLMAETNDGKHSTGAEEKKQEGKAG